MSVRREWWLVCDVCGETNGEGMDHKTKVADAIELFGWRRERFRGGKLKDTCWECLERGE